MDAFTAALPPVAREDVDALLEAVATIRTHVARLRAYAEELAPNSHRRAIAEPKPHCGDPR